MYPKANYPNDLLQPVAWHDSITMKALIFGKIHYSKIKFSSFACGYFIKKDDGFGCYFPMNTWTIISHILSLNLRLFTK